MYMDRTISDQRILEEYKKGSDAVRSKLRELFPEAFSTMINLETKEGLHGCSLFGDKTSLVTVMPSGKFAGEGFKLHPGFDWKIELDDKGFQTLLLKKNQSNLETNVRPVQVPVVIEVTPTNDHYRVHMPGGDSFLQQKI